MADPVTDVNAARILKEKQEYLDALAAYRTILGTASSTVPIPYGMQSNYGIAPDGPSRAATDPWVKENHPDLAAAGQRVVKEEADFLALDEPVSSHAQPNCSIANYTAEKIYEYYAMAEMLYKLATDEKFRELVAEKIGYFLTHGAIGNYLTANRLLDQADPLYREMPDLLDYLLADDVGDAALDKRKAELQSRIDKLESLASIYKEQSFKQMGEYFKSVWDKFKKRFTECGIIYGISTVGIDGLFMGIEMGAGLAFLKGLRFVTRILPSGKLRVSIIDVDGRKLGDAEWGKDALEAKYGKPEETHTGGFEPDANRQIPDKPADDVLREKRDREAAGQKARMEPPPDGAPKWVKGRDPNDPPGVYRASDGKAAIQHPDTGEWTVPQGLGTHKGSFGEFVGTHNLESAGHTPLLPRTPLGGQTNIPGIDQVFRNANPPPPLLVVESKYRTKNPFDIKDFKSPRAGPQMSGKWIEEHADSLFNSGKIDRATHRQLIGKDYTPVLQRIGPDGKVQNIDLKTGKDMKTGEQVFPPQELKTWRGEDD